MQAVCLPGKLCFAPSVHAFEPPYEPPVVTLGLCMGTTPGMTSTAVHFATNIAPGLKTCHAGDLCYDSNSQQLARASKTYASMHAVNLHVCSLLFASICANSIIQSVILLYDNAAVGQSSFAYPGTFSF